LKPSIDGRRNVDAPKPKTAGYGVCDCARQDETESLPESIPRSLRSSGPGPVTALS
jgi:hypothetical protein